MSRISRLRQIFTGRDNSTLDLGRISWVCSYLAVVAHDAYQLYKAAPVTLQELAVALSAVTVAHGAALGLKAKTEPGGEQ